MVLHLFIFPILPFSYYLLRYLTIFTLSRRWLELEQRLRQHQHQHRRDRVRLSQPLGLWLEEEQRHEVVGGRPLEEEDKHLAHLVLGR